MSSRSNTTGPEESSGPAGLDPAAAGPEELPEALETLPASTSPGASFWESPGWRKWEVTVVSAVLAVLVLLVFGQTAHDKFVDYDDTFYVYSNPAVEAGLTLPGVAWALFYRIEGLWTPLVTLSHMVDWQLYGSWAGGHHLTNVALHLCSVILLFLILRQMTGALWRSAFVAALFAIHPLHVESVAWVSERKDVLSGFFFMLTLGAYLRYVQRPGSLGRYLTVLFLFATALLCKPMVVTLPFVLLLVDYWPLKRLFQPPPGGSGPPVRPSINWRAVVEKLPMLGLSLASCAIVMAAPKVSGTPSITQIPFWTRMIEAPVWLATYLVEMFWPSGLAVIYTHFETSLRWAPAAVGWMGAFSLVFFHWRQRHPYLWMGWLWNLVMLMPVLGIIQISRHSRADHYNYLPQIGLYIGLTWFAADWAGDRRPRRMALGAVAALALSALSVVAWRQTGFWRDSVTLWTHTLAITRDNFIARSNLGLALLDEGRLQEGVEQCREALAINPDQLDAQYNLGLALFQEGSADEAMVHSPGAMQGWLDEAIYHYRQALQIDPENVDVLDNLGDALARDGRPEEAITEYRAALKASPDNAETHYDLGKALASLGQTDESIAEYREAVRCNPEYPDAHNNLGIALAKRGQTGEAIDHLEKALELDPSSPSHENNLAWMLATAPRESERNGPRALELALKASRATGGGNPNILHTLAAAYAAAGQFSDAVRTTQQGLQMATARPGAAPLAEELRRELKLYEAGEPYENPR
jgi:tetratricopeptide (TPR) repeat protein